MANRIGGEPQPPSRSPALLLVVVLLVGTWLSWWGTRDHRELSGSSLREPVAADRVTFPQITDANNELVDRGARISQRQCAGCHQTAIRSSGPSYQEIVTFYREEMSASLDGPDLNSRLSSAVTHPRPGWGNFPPGPLQSNLSPEDRVAVASWILHDLDRDSNAVQGVDR